jgi:hypothetical protein
MSLKCILFYDPGYRTMNADRNPFNSKLSDKLQPFFLKSKVFRYNYLKQPLLGVRLY